MLCAKGRGKRPKKITFELRPGHSFEARCDRLVDAY
jgi:hypothetical protein